MALQLAHLPHQSGLFVAVQIIPQPPLQPHHQSIIGKKWGAVPDCSRRKYPASAPMSRNSLALVIPARAKLSSIAGPKFRIVEIDSGMHQTFGKFAYAAQGLTKAIIRDCHRHANMPPCSLSETFPRHHGNGAFVQ